MQVWVAGSAGASGEDLRCGKVCWLGGARLRGQWVGRSDAKVGRALQVTDTSSR